MDKAKLYMQSNYAPRRAVEELFERYGQMINWNTNGDRSIDLGCGDGGVTMDILRNNLPTDYKVLLGCDISESMIRLALERKSDGRDKFSLLDIVGDIPKNLVNNFDHVFSFYAINWVTDQSKAFQNIYELLADGGECLLLIAGHVPIFETYRELAKIDTWKELMGDVEKYISPYHDSQDPETEIKTIMSKVGFKNVYASCKIRTHIYENYERLLNAVLSVILLPFEIPENMFEKFRQDVAKVFWRVNFEDDTDEYPLPALKNYESIVVYGCKGTV